MPCHLCNHPIFEHDKYGCKHSACECKNNPNGSSALSINNRTYDLEAPFEKWTKENDETRHHRAYILIFGGIVLVIAGLMWDQALVTFTFYGSSESSAIHFPLFPRTVGDLFFGLLVLPHFVAGFLIYVGVKQLRKR